MLTNFICFVIGALAGMILTCMAVVAGKDN